MKSFVRFSSLLLSLAASSQTLAVEPLVAQQTKLHIFRGSMYGDGSGPAGVGLAIGRGGVLYGMTQEGGLYAGCAGAGCGTVFQLTPPVAPAITWTYKVIYKFLGTGCNGGYPSAGNLLIDSSGALYGATYGYYPGGALSACGTVFKLSPPAPGQTQWRHQVIAAFRNPYALRGAYPVYVARGRSGEIYVVTQEGGRAVNAGAAYKLTPPPSGQTAWTKTLIYAFKDGADGASPLGELVVAPDGSIFGATSRGGFGPPPAPNCNHGRDGCGTIYKLTPPAPGRPAWAEQVLLRFSNPYAGGYAPQGGLTRDASGALYGMMANGGVTASGWRGSGTIFKLSPPAPGQTAWTKKDIYVFRSNAVTGAAPTGAQPFGKLAFGPSGALYGTAVAGGAYGSGVAFRLTPPAVGQTTWTPTILRHFEYSRDGGTPYGFVTDGRTLFGVTQQGGMLPGQIPGAGTVFKITDSEGL